MAQSATIIAGNYWYKLDMAQSATTLSGNYLDKFGFEDNDETSLLWLTLNKFDLENTKMVIRNSWCVR